MVCMCVCLSVFPQFLISFLPQCLCTCCWIVLCQSHPPLPFLVSWSPAHPWNTRWNVWHRLLLWPEFCASQDGLELGGAPNIIDNTIRILDLNADRRWLMAQNQQGAGSGSSLADRTTSSFDQLGEVAQAWALESDLLDPCLDSNAHRVFRTIRRTTL